MKTILYFISAFVCGISAAQTAPYMVGDWVVDKSVAGIQIAKTTSDSSSAGILCVVKTENCTAFLQLPTPCEVGGLVPLIINSKVGAFAVDGKCLKIGDLWVQEITPYKSAADAFESGGEIGFALPLMSGKFRVVRFDTAGGVAALKAASTLPAAPATRSQTL